MVNHSAYRPTARRGDVAIELDGHVALVEIRRPPNNFFDVALIGDLADALDELAAGSCRAVVLASEGRHFCAGANFGSGGAPSERVESSRQLYREAVRLLEDFPDN